MLFGGDGGDKEEGGAQGAAFIAQFICPHFYLADHFFPFHLFCGCPSIELEAKWCLRLKSFSLQHFSLSSILTHFSQGLQYIYIYQSIKGNSNIRYSFHEPHEKLF